MVLRFNAFSRGAARFGVQKKMPRAIREAYTAPYDSQENRIATLRFVQDIPLRPTDPGYDIVSKPADGLSAFAKTPVLICWGDRDFVFDHHFLRVWKEHWPHAEVHQFPDAGHYVLEDVPEEILSRVHQFFAHHRLPSESGQEGQRSAS
jgi:haloalkane dehalogenase